MKNSLKLLSLLTKHYPVSDGRHHCFTLTDNGMLEVDVWVNDKLYPCTLDQEDLDKNVNVLFSEIKEWFDSIKEGK